MVMLTTAEWANTLQQSSYNPNNYPLTVANPPRGAIIQPQNYPQVPAASSAWISNLLVSATGNPLALPMINQDPFSVYPGIFQAFAAGYPNNAPVTQFGTLQGLG